MASMAIRERRRTLRYCNLLVRQIVQMKNKIGMLLMEAGVSYNKHRLHETGYFRELLATNPTIDEGLGSLLRLCLRNGVLGGLLPVVGLSVCAATGNIYAGPYYLMVVTGLTRVVGRLLLKETHAIRIWAEVET